MAHEAPPDPMRYLWLFLRDLLRKILEGPPDPPPPGEAVKGKATINVQRKDPDDGRT